MMSFLFTHLLWSGIGLAIMLSSEQEKDTVKFEHKVVCFIPMFNSLWLIALILTRGFEMDNLARSMFKGITKVKEFLLS